MTAAPGQAGDLVVTGLTKRYGKTAALSEVDLRVGAGQVHGLLGRNGAGKSTLLSVLLGLVAPDRGTLTLTGRPLAEVRPRVPGGVAGSVEEPRLYPYLTARRTLELLSRLDDPGGLDPGSALDRVGLADQGDRRVGEFSTGMRARLAIAAGLLRRPRLLVLDEPTSGLDPVTARSLLSLLRELADQGTSVVVSSHDLTTVARLCERVTILACGRVALDAEVSALDALAPPPVFALSTTDDATARWTSERLERVQVETGDGGLLVWAAPADLDRFTLALARAGVALRRLAIEVSPLQALFDQLTDPAVAPEPPAPLDPPEPSGNRRVAWTDWAVAR